MTIAGKTLLVSHGVQNGEIDIGIPWLDAAQASVVVQAVTGVGNAPVADSHAQAQAVVDYLNAHGGIDGLKIRPVYYKLGISNDANASGRAQDAQAACAQWTQDNHVFAFLVVIAPDTNYLQCAKNTQTPLLTAGFPELVDSVEYGQIPNLIYAPASMVIDDRERMLVDQMSREGVLNPNTKVGLLVDGSVSMIKRAADNTLLPELKRLHIPVVSEVVFPDCIQSPWDTYVLQMRQAGVTHVYLSGTYCGSVPLLLFGRGADNQKWAPQYILSSDQGPAGNAGENSSHGAGYHGAGWLPLADIGSPTPLTPTATTCNTIMRDAGQAQQGYGGKAGGDIFSTGTSYCETLLFLQAALRGSSQLTPDGVAAGAASLAGTWLPVVTRTTNFGANHHFAADTVQYFSYSPSCKCIAYTGAPFKFR